MNQKKAGVLLSYGQTALSTLISLTYTPEELLKRTPAAFLGSCRYKLPEIHENKDVYEKIFSILESLTLKPLFTSAETTQWIRSKNFLITPL